MFTIFIYSTAGNRTDLPPSLDDNGNRECELCCNAVANVTFKPCGHVIVCADCCIKMKRCLTCRTNIEGKYAAGKKQHFLNFALVYINSFGPY